MKIVLDSWSIEDYARIKSKISRIFYFFSVFLKGKVGNFLISSFYESRDE